MSRKATKTQLSVIVLLIQLGVWCDHRLSIGKITSTHIR